MAGAFLVFDELIFDELLNDPLPQLVKIFRSIRANQPCDENFEDTFQNKKYLRIAVENYTGKKIIVNFELYQYKIKFRQIYLRENFLQMLRKIFDDLLNDKYFPYSYPCFWYLGESYSDDEMDAVTDAIESEHPDWKIDDVYNYAVAQGKLKLTPHYENLLRDYEKMLTKFFILSRL